MAFYPNISKADFNRLLVDKEVLFMPMSLNAIVLAGKLLLKNHFSVEVKPICFEMIFGECGEKVLRPKTLAVASLAGCALPSRFLFSLGGYPINPDLYNVMDHKSCYALQREDAFIDFRKTKALKKLYKRDTLNFYQKIYF